MTASLSEAMRRPALPYDKGIRVTVVARGEVMQYNNQAGEARSCLQAALADSEKTVVCKVYDQSKFPRFVVGKSLIIRNIIKRDDTLIITRTSKVYVLPEIVVPEERYEDGVRLLNPPPAAVVPLQSALQSPSEQKISVVGLIVQEDNVKEVKVRDSPVKIKEIYLRYNTAEKVRVTLWRREEIDASTGSYVKITNLVTNSFRGETSLSSTNDSTVTITEAPEEIAEINVIAAMEEENVTELLLEDGSSRKASTQLVMAALPDDCPSVEDFFITSAPVKINITTRGADVINVVLV